MLPNGFNGILRTLPLGAYLHCELVGLVVPGLPCRRKIEWLSGNDTSDDLVAIADLDRLPALGDSPEDLAGVISKLSYTHLCGHIFVATV